MALIGDSTRVIGLTATPGRSAFDISENARLSEFFFNRIIGFESPGEMSVFSYLRSKHILAHVVNETLTTSQTYALTKDQLSYLEQNYDFSPAFLKTLSADDIRNFEIIKKLLLAANDERRILFFACSIEHSQFICALLTFFGIRASHVDEDSRAERGYIIDAFKDGRIQCYVIMESFDWF
jgi:superfamily II DNA or RNA helicase